MWPKLSKATNSNVCVTILKKDLVVFIFNFHIQELIFLIDQN